MTEKTVKPEIRFAGFTDAWEQRKLGEVADIVGGGTPNTSISEFWDGDIDWYAPAEIADQIYLTSSQRKITEQGYNHSSTKMLPVGTVLFTSRAGIGKTAILSRKGCTNQGFQSIIPHKGELDSYFIFSRTGELKRYGENVGAGSTFVEVSGKQMANMELMMPTTLLEQKAIGQYFANLDNLITLHQRKYDKLTKVKKSMLEKMFPKNGATVPEIRFKGFSDAWEQRKAKDLCSISTGKSNTQDSVDDGIYPFYVRSPIVEHSNRYLFDEEAVLTVGDGVGTGKVFHYVNGKYDLHQRVYRMYDFSEEISAKYFYYYFSNHFYDRVMAMTAKTSVDSVRYEMIADMDIALPKLKEQLTISNYFDRLDNLITLHQRELEKLKNIKKACLEKMFV